MVTRLLQRLPLRKWPAKPLSPEEVSGAEAEMLSLQDLAAAPMDNTEADAKLGRIAGAAVQMAALGPKMAKLAADMENQAQEQARRAAAIADTMEALTQDLERAVAELRASSAQVGDALTTVSRIADHTRIISLNASIEAARAGVHGRAFAVVVEEVQRLADRTGSTTHLIEDRMGEMNSSIVRVASVAGSQNEKRLETSARNVGAVNQEVHGMAHLATEQLDGSHSLHAMSDDILQHTEALLLSVGGFRFEAHAKAKAAVQEILPELRKSCGQRKNCEALLERWLQRHPYFELAYATDAQGIQFIDNIGCRDGSITRDPSCCGRNWSERPWYLSALAEKGVHCTDIYRSSATGDFCFTVAVAVYEDSGALKGVLGADVNFQRLLQH